MFLTWDDHEIRDGWGSRGDEGGEAEQKMFLAATQAYEKYQLAHNPHVDPAKGYYAFQYGKIGFVVLDLRRYRSIGQQTILGDEQKHWLENWLKKKARQCRVVFIACSVPVVHVTHALAMMASRPEMKFVGVSDDLADQWSHASFVKDMQAFAELLFDLANQEGVRFVLLGGDVHVGTFAVLRSQRRQDEFHPVIYQCTSSPISNHPSPNVGKFLHALAQEVQLGRNLPFSGRLLKVFTKRNFAVVEVHQNPNTDEYGVVFEMHCDGKAPERFATLW
jgi:alkaline phosphatase D